MSHRHEKVLATIFHDPISGNVHWREIESLLQSLGATLEETHGARLRVVLNGVEDTLHRPHHSGVSEKHDIRHLREFLRRAGVGPGG